MIREVAKGSAFKSLEHVVSGEEAITNLEGCMMEPESGKF